jgi:hypothetical protein
MFVPCSLHFYIIIFGFTTIVFECTENTTSLTIATKPTSLWCTTASSAHASYKSYGWNKKNRRGRPPATSLSTSWNSGVVRFGRARERRHHLMECIFWEKFGQGGFDTLAESQWVDLNGPSILAEKINHTTNNRRGPLYVRRLAVGRNGDPVCGDGNSGEYSTLEGGGRHGQLVTGRSISMVPPALTP